MCTRSSAGKFSSLAELGGDDHARSYSEQLSAFSRGLLKLCCSSLPPTEFEMGPERGTGSEAAASSDVEAQLPCCVKLGNRLGLVTAARREEIWRSDELR